MRPLGGCLGGMNAFDGAVEHQKCTTPHFHGQGHIVCIYQYVSLRDIADKLSEQLLSVQELKTYQSWMHCEDILDEKVHASFLSRVEDEWRNRFSDKEHHDLCVLPQYAVADSLKHSMMNITAVKSDEDMQHLVLDGQEWNAQYKADVQRVFSRVQHHIHK
eukprot:86384-Karenia_brevis.AAC.1